MRFLARFLLGLAARAEDVEEAREIAPELLAEGAKGRETDEVIPLRVVLIELPEYGLAVAGPEGLRQKLREWLSKGEDARPPMPPPRSSKPVCPIGHPDCPLKAPKGDAATPPEAQAENADGGHTDVDDTSWLGFGRLLLGGHRRNGSKAFFDLVQKTVKPRGDRIKSVTITDRYLHTSFGEDGRGQGFTRLVEFLGVLGLDRQVAFRLELSPAMEGADQEKVDAFRSRISETFPRAEVAFHANRRRFHDRLYVVKDREQRLHGVFGPSLNGLDAESIYLLGELTDEALTQLKDILD